MVVKSRHARLCQQHKLVSKSEEQICRLSGVLFYIFLFFVFLEGFFFSVCVSFFSLIYSTEVCGSFSACHECLLYHIILFAKRAECKASVRESPLSSFISLFFFLDRVNYSKKTFELTILGAPLNIYANQSVLASSGDSLIHFAMFKVTQRITHKDVGVKQISYLKETFSYYMFFT